MISRYSLAITALISCLSVTTEASARCASHKPHSFINYEVSDTEYIVTKDVNSLTAMQGGFSPGHILGLAGGDVGARFMAEFELKPDGDGKYCLYVDKVDAVFYADPKVYIAKNFKKDSCEYSQVLKHEEKHVKVLKNTHRDNMTEFRSHMRWALRDLPVLDPMTIDQANEKRKFFLDLISKKMTVFIQKMNKEVALKQKEVDSKEEYARVMKNCSRWDERIEGNQ